jgi:hypothetical protein
VSIGRDAWIRQSTRLKESWEIERGELDQLHEAGSHVIAETRWITKGKDSGIEFESVVHWALMGTGSSNPVSRELRPMACLTTKPPRFGGLSMGAAGIEPATSRV